MLRRIAKTIALLIIIANLINAQNLVYLEGENKISTSNVEINLVLSNTDTVAGIQTTLKLDKPLLKLDTILTLQNNLLFRYYSPDSVTINIVMLASSGYEFKPGKTTIAKIKFKVLNFVPDDSVSLTFSDLLMIAPKVQKLNATASGITLKFAKNESNLELKFNISYSSIVVYLRNTETIKNINLELRIKNGSTAEFVSPMPRIAGFMKINYTILNDIVKVNLTTTTEYGLEAGEGEIFFITGKFNSQNDIEIVNAKVTNSDGDVVTPNFKLISTDIYPSNFKLEQNYPNPFNPITTIKFTIPKETRVQILVFDITGRLVKTLLDKTLPAGEHLITWDGTDENGSKVSSGV
ncbi:FlgD Ig-like domain-containing protein, partial [Candidatus Kryptonium thompsonii]